MNRLVSQERAEQVAARYRDARDRDWNAEREIRGLEDRIRALRSTRDDARREHDAAYEEFKTTFAPVMVGDGFPHCDQFVLHAPGKCRFCDVFPERQAKRAELGVAFTGETRIDEQVSCPSELLRHVSTINRWPGNRPSGGGS